MRDWVASLAKFCFSQFANMGFIYDDDVRVYLSRRILMNSQFSAETLIWHLKHIHLLSEIKRDVLREMMSLGLCSFHFARPEQGHIKNWFSFMMEFSTQLAILPDMTGAHKIVIQFDDEIFLPTQLVRSWTPFFKHVSVVVQKHVRSGSWDISPKSALYLYALMPL